MDKGTDITFTVPFDQIDVFINILWDGISENIEDTDPEFRIYLSNKCDQIFDAETRRKGGIGLDHER